MAKKKLSDLTPDASNANKGTERGRYAIEASLRKYGTGRSILLDKHGHIIAGNKTAEVAADVGIDDVLIVQTDGRKLVAVQRTDLDIDSPEGRGLAYADNRTAELSLSWDADQVLADVQAGMDLSAFWREDELAELLDDMLTPSDNASDEFGDFGASTNDGFVAFRFGDYGGRISRSVYDSFVDAYKEHQRESGEPMLDDVLRGWLGV